MRKIRLFLVFLFGLNLMVNTANAQTGTTRTVIIQFTSSAFEKQYQEIIHAFKGITGIDYLGHCISQSLFVIEIDMKKAGVSAEVDKTVKEKIPAGLPYEIKEGTLMEMKNHFGYCLIAETL